MAGCKMLRVPDGSEYGRGGPGVWSSLDSVGPGEGVCGSDRTPRVGAGVGSAMAGHSDYQPVDSCSQWD